MARHYLNKGAVTFVLPYAQTHNETMGVLGAEYTFMSGEVDRDFVLGEAHFYKKISITWADQSTLDFEAICDAWKALTEEDTWQYHDPNGDVIVVMLDPDNPTLDQLRYGGVNGTVLWECSLRLVSDA